MPAPTIRGPEEGQAVRFVAPLAWDVNTLTWIYSVPAVGGVGGGGDASAANQLLGNASLASIDTKVTGLATAANQTAEAALIGATTETAPVSDTALSGLNGRLQRIAQRLSSLILLLPTALSNGFLQVSLKETITVPVSGAFFQATQPVSFAQQALPANQSVNAAQMAGTATAVNSGLKDNGTQRVVLATDQPALTNKLLVTPDSVALPANQSVNVNQFGGSAVATGTGAAGAGVPRVTVSNDSNVLVTPPALTKGTQGSTGLSVQRLNDAGRNATHYFMAAGIAGTNAEVMQSLTGYKGGAAVAATVTPAVVTTGKVYRVTSITLSYQSLATAGGCMFRLRANLAGAGVIGSPLVMNFVIGSAAAVAGITTTLTITFPEGLEFAAATGIAVGMLGLSVVGAAAAAGFGTITISGYEY